MRIDCISLLLVTNQLLQKVVVTQNLHFITCPSTLFYPLAHTATSWRSQTPREEFGETSGPMQTRGSSGLSATSCMLMSFPPLSLCSVTFSGLFDLHRRRTAVIRHWFLHPAIQINKERLLKSLLSSIHPKEDLSPRLGQVPLPRTLSWEQGARVVHEVLVVIATTLWVMSIVYSYIGWCSSHYSQGGYSHLNIN